MANQDNRIAGTYVSSSAISESSGHAKKKMFSLNCLEYSRLYIGNNVVSLSKSHINIYKHIVNLVNGILATLIIPQYSKQDRTKKIICTASGILREMAHEVFCL